MRVGVERVETTAERAPPFFRWPSTLHLKRKVGGEGAVVGQIRLRVRLDLRPPRSEVGRMTQGLKLQRRHWPHTGLGY